MLLILPLIFSAILIRVFLDDGFSWRVTVLRTATLAGVITAISTEMLSAFWALTPQAISITWVLVSGAAGLYLYKRKCDVLRSGGVGKRHAWRAIHILYLLPAFVLIAIVTANALLVPSHIGDVLTYHLPRIRFWLQNQTVAFYPSPFPPQLFMPPWTEYAGTHYMALTGAERGLGLIQTVSMALCPVAVSGIAGLLGLDAVSQLLAGMFALTIPQGAMEAYDLKNDYVCAFWIATAVYFLLLSTRSEGMGGGLFAGAAVGLALLTKSTAYLYIAPFLLAYAVKLLYPSVLHQSMSSRTKLVVATILPIVVLNIPHWTRNHRAFGSPLGCQTAFCDGNGGHFRNGAINRHTTVREIARTTVENIARNIGIHLGTNSAVLNRKIEAGLTGIIRAAGGDPNDPQSTWEGMKFSILPPIISSEYIGNPWHLLAIATAFAMLLLRPNKKARGVLLYAACVAGAALIFCILLRWQIYHSRLQLPLFILSAPVVAAAFARWPSSKLVLGALCLILFVPAIVDTYVYQLRSLVPLRELLRWQQPHGADSVPGSSAARKIRDWTGCRRVGLDTTSVPWFLEGQLLSILGVGTGGAYVRHINLGGPDDLNQYCAILCVSCNTKPVQVHLYHEVGFQEEKEENGATLFYRTLLPTMAPE